MAYTPTELETYIEKLGTYFSAQNRMPRSVSRVLAFLLVSDPPHQTAEQIAENLKMSAGATSIAVNMLQQTGLIQRVHRPGDRKYYYEMAPEGWRQSVEQRLKSLSYGITLAKEGIELTGNNPRLGAMRDIYSVFESDAASLLERYQSQTKQSD